MLGERGGNVHSLDEALDLHEITKPEWVALVKTRIMDILEQGSFHADDLRYLGVPEDHKSVIGNAVGALVRAGLMVEVGRRKSVAPERHGAKSSVYEITDKGRVKLAGVAVTSPCSQQTVVPHGGSDPGECPTGSAGVSSSPVESVHQDSLFPLDDATPSTHMKEAA